MWDDIFIWENVGINSSDQYVIYSYANPTIQWEIAEQTNLGLEVTLFKGLLDFTVDFYEEIRHNILSSRKRLCLLAWV